MFAPTIMCKIAKSSSLEIMSSLSKSYILKATLTNKTNKSDCIFRSGPECCFKKIGLTVNRDGRTKLNNNRIQKVQPQKVDIFTILEINIGNQATFK